MDRKGSIELSINTLVIIIISLVILGSGVAFLYQLGGGATDIKTKLDQQTQEELERLLVDQGKQVALPLHVADVSRGESHAFGLGILNIGGKGDQFRIKVTPSKAADEQGNEIKGVDAGAWLLYNEEPMTILKNEHRKESILVSVPQDARRGMYIFTAKVLVGDDPYGNPQKFTVNVK
ncbi:hypothetical protein HYX14_05795 [Candidatus Woesearchaeota archaeon]|nr:hypothetical protein [Candidatus Woesearchaeota archaeon]